MNAFIEWCLMIILGAKVIGIIISAIALIGFGLYLLYHFYIEDYLIKRNRK